MRSIVFYIVLSIISALSMCTLTCCGKADSHTSQFSGDTVTFKTVKLNDSSSYVKPNGEICVVDADISASIPVKFGTDEPTSQSLIKFFKQYLLDASDSITLDNAIKQYIDNTLHQYNFKDTPEENAHDDSSNSEPVLNYRNSIHISVIYNQHNLITFCKREVIKKDDVVTSVTHRYFSFDLETCTLVELNKLFKEELISSLCRTLKTQLAHNNRVENDDQLNDCGFFNIDNMTVTSNFYFDENSIVWSYLPNELAVETLGEPEVKLNFEALEPYLCENSILKRLM